LLLNPSSLLAVFFYRSPFGDKTGCCGPIHFLRNFLSYWNVSLPSCPSPPDRSPGSLEFFPPPHLLTNLSVGSRGLPPFFFGDLSPDAALRSPVCCEVFLGSFFLCYLPEATAILLPFCRICKTCTFQETPSSQYSRRCVPPPPPPPCPIVSEIPLNNLSTSLGLNRFPPASIDEPLPERSTPT